MKLLFYFIQSDRLIPLHGQIEGQLASTELDINTARRAGNQQAIDTNEKKKIVITNEHHLGTSTIYQFVG